MSIYDMNLLELLEKSRKENITFHEGDFTFVVSYNKPLVSGASVVEFLRLSGDRIVLSSTPENYNAEVVVRMNRSIMRQYRVESYSRYLTLKYFKDFVSVHMECKDFVKVAIFTNPEEVSFSWLLEQFINCNRR